MANNAWGDDGNEMDPLNIRYGGYTPRSDGGTGAIASPVVDPSGKQKAGPPGPGGGGLPFGSSGSGNSIIDTYMGAGAAPAAGTAATTGAGAATGAGILGSSLKWGDIINAALAIYSLKKADQTPNFYPVPPSPSETYRLDKTKSLYDFASNYTEQYLKGLNSLNPDFQMPNSATGNPAFMGGVKVPTIDFGKMPSISGAPPEASQAVSSIPPGITPERVKVDPATGKWSVDNPTPAEQAWLDAANRTKMNVPAAPAMGGGDTYAP